MNLNGQTTRRADLRIVVHATDALDVPAKFSQLEEWIVQALHDTLRDANPDVREITVGVDNG